MADAKARVRDAILNPWRTVSGRLRPRRFQAFGVGTAKSGTHSLAAMFRAYRSEHEPGAHEIMRATLKAAGGGMRAGDCVDFLARRDRHLWLEMDSSQLNYFFVPELVSLHPEARFILTIRDCYSWLDSLINHQLSRPASSLWQAVRDLRFRGDGSRHPSEEAVLRERGLYTLDGYLTYWAAHNRDVIQAVPASRLLTIRTDALGASVSLLARFLGIPAETVDAGMAHQYSAKAKMGVLGLLDEAYLEGKVAHHCSALMSRFFPEYPVAPSGPDWGLSDHPA